MKWLDRNRWIIIAALAFLIFVGIGFFSYRQTILPCATEITVSPPPSEITVHVSGEVIVPGVYIVKAGDRISEAIVAAGGFTEEADREALNLATLLRDGDQVVVYTEGDTPQKISINRAEVWLLESLPGIGEISAQRIVEYREEHGSFVKIEDLMNVEGLGRTTFEKIKDLITVR